MIGLSETETTQISAGDRRIEDLKQNPRGEFLQAIGERDLARCLVKTAEIHGHFCPGSALGVMASVYGLNLLGLDSISSDGLEDLMAVVEINACFADGVQAVSGCTLGNNALVYRDLGRLAVTFAIRGKGSGVRIRVRPDFSSSVAKAAPEFYPLMEKVIKNREGGAKEKAAFRNAGRQAAFGIIHLPFDELFAVETVEPLLPEYAPITESIVCSNCGEMIMAPKSVSGLCLMCAGVVYRQVEGKGIVVKKAERQSASDQELT
ncbi:MAG: formylmethanofuran dehydrogenase [Methanotrichaceae archaeon]|nr:formylmethanofuran dehydrogenase [Methanotrichaceae archaeon]